jgi:hypothetical protein
MPANLPPQYFEAEQRFREAKTPEDKVEALEEMLAIMPKHKGTDKLKAMLRERISKFRDQAQKKKGGRQTENGVRHRKRGGRSDCGDRTSQHRQIIPRQINDKCFAGSGRFPPYHP